MTKTAQLLCDLIALPSVNPAFLAPGDPHAGEARVADFLAGMARRARLDVELQPVLPDRSNLVVRLAPCGRVRRRVMLVPHLDTVGGAQLPGTLLTPRLKAGRLFGRGACDTKGSVAAMLMAVFDLAEAGARPAHTEFIFAGLVDEESSQAGSRALAASGIEAELAIVGEPTRLKVVTAHKGAVWLRLQTKGKAAHGARPELGHNAIHAMARIVDLLETQYAARLRHRRHPLLGHATINVGSILGGRQANIVPDECSILIDRRTLPGETQAGVFGELRILLRQHNFRATMRSIQGGICGPMETDAQKPIVQELFRSIGQKKPVGVDYFSDAGVLSAAGIPSVVFGPGDIAQAHTSNEWISLRQLERAKDLLVRFMGRLE